MVYNRGYVVAGIAVFLVIALAPLWYNLVSGKGRQVPELTYPVNETRCVEDKTYMKTNHVVLLNQWKEDVVRNGIRTYTAGDGKTYTMSLTGTCMKCHTRKEDFCDRCHGYAGIASPRCWDCHIYEKAVLR